MVWLSTNNMRGEPLFAKINRLARLVKCWEDLGKCRTGEYVVFFVIGAGVLLALTVYVIYKAIDNMYYRGFPPTPLQKSQIKRAVNIIKLHGSESHKRHISTVIFRVEVSLADQWTEALAFTPKTIILTQNLLLRVDDEFLASTIVHEQVHSFDFNIWVRRERTAYQA